MTFTQQQNRLTMHFSEGIPVVKQRISVVGYGGNNCGLVEGNGSSFTNINPYLAKEENMVS